MKYVSVKVADGRKLAALVIAYLELYIDRCAVVILIFDLGFGKSRFVVRAPINGLQTLVDIAFLDTFRRIYAHLALLQMTGAMVSIADVASHRKHRDA